MAPAHPIIVFGTGNVGISWGGPATTEEGLPGTLDALGRLGITRIDTAAAYPALGEKGLAERILGRARVGSHPAGFEVDTKIFVSLDARAGSLSAAKVRESAAESVARLGVGCVNVLYCHWPDDETPLEEQVEALEEQRREGRCKQIGLSNFTPEMIEDWVAICKRKGYALPAVYQGKYSLVFRQEEATVLPVLRRHGIAFYGYSVLASGFLAGKFTAGTAGEGSRFADRDGVGPKLRAVFGPPRYHDAVRALQAALAGRGIGPTGAALRWAAYHSALRADLGDGIVLGASRVEQLEQIAADLTEGPLPAEVVEAIEEIWRQLDRAGAAETRAWELKQQTAAASAQEA